MKKLLIVASALMCAVVANAATFTWGTGSSYIYIVPSGTIAGGLIDGKSYTAETLKATSSTYTGSPYSGTLSFVLTITDPSILDPNAASKVFEGTLAKGAGLTSMGAVSKELSDALIVGGKDYSYTLTFTAKFKDGKSNDVTLTSNTISDMWHANDQGDIGLTTAGPSTWTASVAPEPTSGLMLLLGVGLMALKRKRV